MNKSTSSQRNDAPASLSKNDFYNQNEIGERLRQRRKVRGASLKTIAGQANISIGLLSQIERGQTLPSVRSLGAVCAALEMPVSWLFESKEELREKYVIRNHQRRILDLGSKGMRKELMTPDDITDVQMMRLVIQPGGSTGETAYRHDVGTKCGVVLRGQLGLEIDGSKTILQPQDSIAFPAKCLIRMWCEGPETTEVIWVVTPAVY